MCNYKHEMAFITESIYSGYDMFFQKGIEKSKDKSEYDIVTSVDYGIESYLIDRLKAEFPDDKIHSEEYNYETEITGRTWTIDPIDGTVNMANGLPIFGVQCALIENGAPVLGVIYLPTIKELYTAVKGCGAYLNGNQIRVSTNDIAHSILSFGDFPHKRIEDATIEYKMIGKLSQKISRIRMFGAASVDFAFVAAGRTSGTVIFTKNKWDIVPGMIICKEAGAHIMSLKGEYSFNDNVIIAVANKDLYNEIKESAY